MMQPGKWWWGLLPLAVLFAVVMSLTTGPVEGDLVKRASDSLKTSGLGWASATLSGRDAVVTGEAPMPESQKLALSAAERAWGVRQVIDKTTVLPEQKPFTASATRDGNKITLAGYVPGDEIRAEMVKAAKASFPGADVVDQLKIARGAAPVYAPALGFGVSQLGKLASGVAGLTDSAFSLVGQAADFAGFDAVTAALKSLPAGVTLAKAEIGAPRISPFVFSAVKAADGVTLGGLIPAETARAGILAAAKAAAGAGAVIDNLRVAAGLPASVNFADATGFALAQLGKLKTGNATLSDARLTVTGDATDVASYESVAAALNGASLPGGVQLASQAITPPVVSPYTWSATRGAGSLTLSGFVPSDAVRGGILDAARKAFPTDSVLDQMKLALGAPNGFANATSALLGQLAKLTNGAASISGASVKISGEAADGAGLDQIRAALASGLSGFSSDISALKAKVVAAAQAAARVRPVLSESAQVCQKKYLDLLEKEQILFASGRADIQEKSEALINALADAVKSCPEYKLEIEGHTDSDGSPDANLDLSRRRAEAVVSALAKLGLPRDSLEAKGFGETMPVASNDTAENKAKNRRIEFVVVEK